MSEMIFVESCLKYWDAGLGVMPLRYHDKKPVVRDWSRYGLVGPTDDEKLAWVQGYPRGNIGLPLGKASGVTMIDIDTDDPVALGALEAVLPPSPWKRVGAHGYAAAYQWSGEGAVSIRDGNGKEIVGIMGTGRQLVLPPSIHPTTQRPYTANCHLADVVKGGGGLPALPKGVEAILRGALTRAGVKLMDGKGRRGGGKVDPCKMVSLGGRDNMLTEYAGRMARHVLVDGVPLKAALEDIENWVAFKLEASFGDDIPAGKGAAKVIEFLRKDIFERQRKLPAGWDVGIGDEERVAWGIGDIGVAQRRLTADEIRGNWMTVIVPRLGGGDPTSEIGQALTSVVANPDLKPMELEGILRMLNESTGKKLGITAIRTQLKELRKGNGDIDGGCHLGIAMPALSLIERGGQIAVVNEDMWQWRGDCWVPLAQAVVEKLIMDEFGGYEAAKKRNDWRQIYGAIGIQAERSALKRVDYDGLNFLNGFLTKEGDLLPHHPDHGCTYVLDYPYLGSDAAEPVWFLSLLERAFSTDPDYRDKVACLQEFYGATLMGVATKYRKCLGLVGLTGCGKSLQIDIMQGLLPPGAYDSVRPDSWRETFIIAQLRGKLMNSAGELSGTVNIPDDLFKTVIGGELMQMQEKYRKPVSGRLIAAHWFASNHLPATRDTSDAFGTRWLFIKFNNQIPENQQDKDGLAGKVLAAEREAIAAWAIEGYQRLLGQGSFTTPASCYEMRQELQEKLDPVEEFLSDARKRAILRFGDGGRLSHDALYQKFKMHVAGRGAPCRVDSVEFLSRMATVQTKFGFHTFRNGEEGNPLPFYSDVRLVLKAA